VGSLRHAVLLCGCATLFCFVAAAGGRAQSLVKDEVYNPAKRRAWTLDDAKERWEEVKKQAQEDKRKCELVQSLPKLEKRLQELQAAAEKKE
jgi:hypothetical protein